MKIKNYIYSLFAIAASFSACKKSFLNEIPPTSIAVNDAIKTENDLSDAVNGMYVAMKPSTLFGRDIPVLGDLLADNTYISSSNAGRYLVENNYSFIATTGEASNIWGQGYYAILQANRIISTAIAPSNNVNQLKGEAYVARALTYLELVNFYATPYTVNSAAAGVPLVTTPTNISGAFIKPARSSVAAVYTQIISDLDSAYTIMPATGTTLHVTSSNYISKYAVKAIEARAYLYKGDYANARDAALAVVQGGGYSLTTTASAFTSYWASPTPVTNKLETIFELSMTSTSNNGFDGLDAFYNQAGYGDMLATSDLYNSYSVTDFRKTLILNGNRAGNQAYIVNKYTNLTNTDRDEVKVIRYAEVILTLAEGYAGTGDNVNALIYLNQLAKLRDPAFIGYTSTGPQLISDIINERRKELAFEGLRFFDLTRTNSIINRPQMANSYPSYPTVTTSNTRRVLPIPQGEINANPGITQNPGY